MTEARRQTPVALPGYSSPILPPSPTPVYTLRVSTLFSSDTSWLHRRVGQVGLSSVPEANTNVCDPPSYTSSVFAVNTNLT